MDTGPALELLSVQCGRQTNSPYSDDSVSLERLWKKTGFKRGAITYPVSGLELITVHLYALVFSSVKWS